MPIPHYSRVGPGWSPGYPSTAPELEQGYFLAASMTAQPTDDELAAALRDLRISQPTAGITKLHASLVETRPEWVVSAKRTRKILQQEGLILDSGGGTGNSSKPKAGLKATAPEYRLNPLLDVSKLSGKIRVHDFGLPKGKGIVLTDSVKQGETIWNEDPFVFAPAWEVLQHVHRGNACAHCLSGIKQGSSLIMSCPATRLSDAPNPCSARFCTRLCLQRAISHPMLCVAQNPAIVPLLSLSRQYQWQALIALASCASRIMLATSAQDQREAFAIYESLAYVEPGSPLWRQIIRPSEQQLESGYTVYTSALTPGEIKPAPTPTLRKALKTAPPLPEHMQKELFSPEGFRRGMARMNLNLETNGGLHALHSHLNHSCDPNVSAKHLDQRNALARLSLVAHRDLSSGDELCISYVDPADPMPARRLALRAWGIPNCECTKCVTEEKELREKGEWTDEMGDPASGPVLAGTGAAASSDAPATGQVDGTSPMPAKELENLESELKTHLGLF